MYTCSQSVCRILTKVFVCIKCIKCNYTYYLKYENYYTYIMKAYTYCIVLENFANIWISIRILTFCKYLHYTNCNIYLVYSIYFINYYSLSIYNTVIISSKFKARIIMYYKIYCKTNCYEVLFALRALHCIKYYLSLFY